MTGIALPFPQRAAVPLVLSARFTAPLTVDGYDFTALEPVDMVNVSAGYLYRILSYSWALELPEDVYQASQLAAYPMGFQIRTTGNMTDVLAKPVAVPCYQRDAALLQYFQVPDTATGLEAKALGRLSTGSVGTLGYSSISATLSIFVQALGDSEWAARFEAGEI